MAYYLPTITSAPTEQRQRPTFAEQSDQFLLINSTNTITNELSSGISFYARRPSDWQLPLDYQVVSSGVHADWEGHTFTVQFSSINRPFRVVLTPAPPTGTSQLPAGVVGTATDGIYRYNVYPVVAGHPQYVYMGWECKPAYVCVRADLLYVSARPLAASESSLKHGPTAE